MDQELFDVVVNVVDHGASPMGATTAVEARANTTFINDAILLGRHVLFPAGTYAFRGILRFPNDDQQCTFLAGAVLVPCNSESYVLITGERQTFIGLRIEAPSDMQARSPLVEIYGASGLVMEELRVSVTSMYPSVSGPMAAVRLMFLRGCTFIGGAISGGQESGSVGLSLASSYDYDRSDPNPSPGEWYDYPDVVAQSTRGERQRLGQTTSGAYDVSADGLLVESFGWGVRIACITEKPTFTGCTFSDNVDGALVVRDDADVLLDTHIRMMDPELLADAADAEATQTIATGLTLSGCRLGGATPPQYVHVQEPRADGSGGGGSVQGGIVLGCMFGEGGAAAGLGRDVGALPASKATVAAARRMIPSVNAVGTLVRMVPDSKRTVPVRPASPGGSADSGQGASPLTSRLIPPLSGRAVAAQESREPVDTPSADGPCIFLVEGEVSGVFVSGCYSALSATRQCVWRITDTAVVSQTCDSFNRWAEPTIAVGDHASQLIRMSSGESGRLTLTAQEVCIDAVDFGGFDATPTTRASYGFASGGSGDRSLSPGREHLVLRQLLNDLCELGLIRRGGPASPR